MLRAGLTVALSLVLVDAARAETAFQILSGHGGPIMSVDIGPDGTALTGSFDNALGLWDLDDAAPRWLDGHEAAVKTAVFVGDDRIASAGDDDTILIWDRASGSVLHRITGHSAKIMALAASPDGRMIASASWDRTVGIWDVETGALIQTMTGHSQLVNDVAFGAEGTIYSAANDGTVRQWRVADGTQIGTLVRHGFGVNRLLVDPAADWLAYGAVDGGTRAIQLSTGTELADLTLDRRPILSMARRADGGQIAVGDGEGYIMVVNTADWSIVHDFRAARQGPIWALGYTADGTGLLAGGIEDAAYLWPLSDLGTGTQMAEQPREFHVDPATVSNGERQFLRKCSICHSLTDTGGRKAGPTLRGLFGREAGAVAGYTYSDAVAASDIIWEAETIDALFRLGPDHYTPGSKMPMQQITGADDRADLIAYLRAATAVDD
ncbi:MAG: c-type cytochrome [Pseudomonadota bacterium]